MTTLNNSCPSGVHSKNENHAIAEALYKALNMSPLEQRNLRKNGNHMKLTEEVDLKWSEELLAVYLFKTFSDQARSFVKVVPALGDLKEKQLEKILSSQPWVCL